MEISSSIHVNNGNLGEKRSPDSVELYELIKEPHGETGFRDLNRTFMRREIQGKVYVATRTKGKRRVELIEAKES